MSEDVSPSASTPKARVTVRGTKDDEKAEAKLREWESAVRADAADNDGVVPPRPSFRSNSDMAVRITDDPPPMSAPGDTETELNGLIAECRFLMREVAFNSARLTYDPDDRIRFLHSAESLASTAAKIGDTVAKLRSASGTQGPVETHRHEMVYSHVHTTPLPPCEADLENQ